jgi:predicted Zn-dependent protease
VAPDEIESLREAVQASPGNVALRRHLAERLLLRGRPDEAEREAKAALSIDSKDERARLTLASAFLAQERPGEAMVIVEQVMRAASPPPAASLLHARLLLREGDAERAVRQYRRAVEEDATLADPALEERLGIGQADADESEVVEGRARASNQDPADVPAETERPKVTFADVGGMEARKDAIRPRIIHPLTHPEV